MGILSGLFRTRDGPKNATSGSAYSFFMLCAIAAVVNSTLVKILPPQQGDFSGADAG